MTYLELSGVGWTPPGAPSAVLDQIDLRLEAGQWLAITGASGGGKTTLLSIAAGLLRPSTGSVCLFGQPLAREGRYRGAELRAGKVGLIFQNYQLDDSRSCVDNILLPGYFSSQAWYELRQRAAALAERLGLTAHLHKPVSVLSGGQRQRVAVARALLLRPRLVLADEPTGALDQVHAELVLELLQTELGEEAAFLAVTHDSEVLERSQRRLELVEGRLRPASEGVAG